MSEDSTSSVRSVADADMEARVLDRLRRMSDAILKVVGTDNIPREAYHAVDGLVNGTAADILYVTGVAPCYKNIHRFSRTDEE